MLLSGFVNETESDIVDDTHNVQGGTNQGGAHWGTGIVIEVGDGNFVGNSERDTVVETVTTVDQS